MLIPALMAAALSLPSNKVVKPGLGNRVVIRTQAVLGGSQPGQYEVKAYKNSEKDTPGELIENIRIRPKTIFLRDNDVKRLTLSIDSSDLEPGPLWICIAEAQDSSGSLLGRSRGQLQIRTQSCYQRILQKRN